MSILSDSEIIEQLIKGDTDGIRALYQDHFATLCRFVENNNGSVQDAQDLFQEVIILFIRIVREGKFRGASSIATFLYALNRNLWYNELKRRGRAHKREEQYSLGQQEEALLDRAVENRESQQFLMKMMEKLGENCKKILLLYYYENKQMKEIASVMHYENEQVVRNKKYKCLRKLEEQLKNDEKLYNKLKNLFHD